MNKKCNHNKNKNNCIICSPNSFCEHKKLKSKCQLCTEQFISDILKND